MKILAKRAILFINHQWRKPGENGPDPRRVIRVEKDEITELPDWVQSDRTFLNARADGDLLVLADDTPMKDSALADALAGVKAEPAQEESAKEAKTAKAVKA